MAEERKGALTPAQEKTLDKLVKFNNKLAEALDGPAISLIDNQGIERILDAADKKNPEIRPVVLEVVDIIFAGLEEIIPEEQ